MSEVSKRDSQAKVINKYAAFSERINDTTSAAEVHIRKRELDIAWQKFQDLHEKVMDRAGTSEVEEQEGIANGIENTYVAASIRFEKALASLQTHKSTTSQAPKQLMPRHNAVARLLVNIEQSVAADLATFDAAAASSQLRELDELHTQYRAAVLDAMQAASDSEAAILIEAQAATRSSYLRTVALVQGVITRATPAPIVAPHVEPAQLAEIKIAAVQIGTFDGSSARWESFRESYEQVYHLRQSMPAVQKLQHLKSCLRGEAEELVANFSLTNENYEAAWSLLKQRYDNPYELTRAHLRTLNALPSCKESASDLRKLMNRTSSTLLALRNLKRPVEYWDDFIVVLVTDKLDIETRKMWEQANCSGTDFPKWTTLETFIENRVRALDAIGPIKSSSPSNSASSSAQQKKVRAHTVTTTKPHVCPMCADDHAIYACHAFRQLNVVDRRALVSTKRLCFICLSSAHMATSCKSNRSCRFCNGAHNSLLHIDKTPPVMPITPSAEPTTPSARPTTTTHSMIGLNPSGVMLGSALVHVRASNGDMHSFRALLDSGSQSSFITERAVQILRLPKQHAEFDMMGIGETSCGKATRSVSATIHSRHNDFAVPITALVLRNVSRVAGMPMHVTYTWPHLTGLALADPDYQHPSSFDLLLGAEVYAWCLLPELRKAGINDPVGQNSQFGWLISGPASESSGTVVQTNKASVSVNCLSLNSRIDECLERFWTIEDIEQRRSKTIDEEACESHFDASTTRDSDGRFHVRIPFRKSQPALGESLRMAIQRQHQMERKFLHNATFAFEYRKFMSQYLELGHMKLIASVATLAQQPGANYYIPHHAVLKESSSTTKLRVVFDASRRTSNGLSLNEQMLPGPRLQEDLSAIVMRWRKHRIVFTADVERMYRQIIVDEPDADFQRIVWRTQADEPMQIYQLTTVTYGTTSAPYLAVKALQTLATIERDRYPVGAAIALQDFYVDDVLTGFDDIPAAMRGPDQLRKLMNSGGFELKKWASNCSALLDHLPDGFCECRIPLQLNLDQHVKTLGIHWNPVTDMFSFKVEFSDDNISSTKRQFLSDAARLYDPLGWLAPSVILVKIMFQRLWQLKLGWDERLPSPLADELQLRRSFEHLREMRINRWVHTASTSAVELHGFCDSSIHAYAAAVYVRTTTIDGATKITLLCAKTKVAPLKTISLPRLELSGALLLCRLMQTVQISMKFEKHTTFCWTDSTIVLAWIKGNPARWSVFVANRVAEIQRSYPVEHWHHVPTDHNPADCASRGVPPEQLAAHDLWWSGPQWLSQPSNCWPIQFTADDTTEEMRAKSITLKTHVELSWALKDKYSTLSRLIRVTAYCIRFTRNARSSCRTGGPLRHDELQAAQIIWIRDAQQTHFAEELTCLRQQKPIDRSSVLRSLNPVLQADKLIHVGGRLVNALVMPEQARTPIIIPRRCRLAELLVDDAHQRTLHGGPSLMLAKLRRQFWIIDGPKHVRQFVKKCNRCFRFTSTLGQQMMGALPAARITPSRPFSHTAMDYSGAVMVRSSRGRGQHSSKGYIAVFVCLSTKAIHIEVVSDLTSIAFIAAYKRFAGRRGICSDLYSDNATNYVGAAAVFRNTERDLGFDNKIISTLATMGTRWHFSPPLAPHFNGLAESAIRSVKHHIRRIIGESMLTYEELCTFLIQVECCLNSRPLYPLSSDPTDFAVLTPGHFLIGAPLNAVPERSVLSAKPHALNRWTLVQQMLQRFWVQWSSEYLHTLQQRRKWQREQPNFAVGDMVIIAEDNYPPSSWALGRVLELHPGQDGKVRVVTLRTAKQTMKRSIVKLARLPTQGDDDHEDQETDGATPGEISY